MPRFLSTDHNRIHVTEVKEFIKGFIRQIVFYTKLIFLSYFKPEKIKEALEYSETVLLKF